MNPAKTCIGVCPKDAVTPANDEAFEILGCKIAEYAKAVCADKPHFHICLAIDISPFCDCHSENDAAVVPDVGMFASFDPVAIDVACADAINAQPPIANSMLGEAERCHHDHFIDISPTTDWHSQTEHGEKIGLGSREYELVRV